jgi:hypothetical protein
MKIILYRFFYTFRQKMYDDLTLFFKKIYLNVVFYIHFFYVSVLHIKLQFSNLVNILIFLCFIILFIIYMILILY